MSDSLQYGQVSGNHQTKQPITLFKGEQQASITFLRSRWMCWKGFTWSALSRACWRWQQLIRECLILCNIEPKQIKVWFHNHRCREKQRKETSRLQKSYGKLTAMNNLMMEENDRLQKQVGFRRGLLVKSNIGRIHGRSDDHSFTVAAKGVV